MRHFRQAVGPFEAAAIMGVHFTVPPRMADRGLLSVHRMGESSAGEDQERAYSIYDGAECEENYREYDAKVSSRGGKSDRRPRAWLHLRPDVIKHLKSIKTPIAFDDAIGVMEAAKLLGVSHTLVPRYLRDGRLVGRVLWSHRGRGTRVWIVSRKSCLANAREFRAREAAGTKPGRLRKKVS